VLFLLLEVSWTSYSDLLSSLIFRFLPIRLFSSKPIRESSFFGDLLSSILLLLSESKLRKMLNFVWPPWQLSLLWYPPLTLESKLKWKNWITSCHLRGSFDWVYECVSDRNHQGQEGLFFLDIHGKYCSPWVRFKNNPREWDYNERYTNHLAVCDFWDYLCRMDFWD
jgi:hypothetical protein